MDGCQQREPPCLEDRGDATFSAAVRAIYSLSMSSLRRAMMLMFVAGWILLGPIAMAFGGCLLMGDCDALCGTLATAQLAATLVPVTLISKPLWSWTAPILRTPALFVIEPPPRLYLPA